MNTGASVQSPQPDDLSRVAPRRLAIYGEGPRGIFAREAFASSGFGEWLTSSGRNHERYWALVDFVDADFDPHDASVDEWFHFRDDLLDYVKSLRAAHPEAAK